MHTDTSHSLEHTALQFKGGSYTLTTLNILDNNLRLLDDQLKSKISQAPIFFRNAPIIIDLKTINAQGLSLNLTDLKNMILNNNFILVGLRNTTPEQQATAEALGLAVLRTNRIDKETLDAKPNSLGTIMENKSSQQSLVISQPVRSGEQIFAPQGDLIVLASVGNGAELLADGHIHIYGSMRGRALAGINGNKTARIFCKSLEAELVSIAGIYQVSEEIEKHAWKIPAMVAVKEDRLQIMAI